MDPGASNRFVFILGHQVIVFLSLQLSFWAMVLAIGSPLLLVFVPTANWSKYWQTYVGSSVIAAVLWVLVVGAFFFFVAGPSIGRW